MFFRKIMKQNMTQAPIVYQSGTNVKLIHKAEYCKSIIADGKELITGDEYGEIRVPELKDPKVYITFKEGITNFSDAFYGCLALKSIPTSLFDNNRKVNSFMNTFRGCSALTGESPYTMIGDQKVHIYERQNYPEHFTAPTNSKYTFKSCTGLTDYDQIPSWK